MPFKTFKTTEKHETLLNIRWNIMYLKILVELGAYWPITTKAFKCKVEWIKSSVSQLTHHP